jgi:nucleoside-diphosphate-sugar epimerase
MSIVVTGAAGYIGGQIALQLRDAGHEVVGIDCRPCPSHLTDAFTRFVQEVKFNEIVLLDIPEQP